MEEKINYKLLYSEINRKKLNPLMKGAIKNIISSLKDKKIPLTHFNITSYFLSFVIANTEKKSDKIDLQELLYFIEVTERELKTNGN